MTARSLRFLSPAFAAIVLLFAPRAFAQVKVSSTVPFLNTFVTDGTNYNASPDYDYGGAGALVVAGANSGNGTFETVMQFNLSSVAATFNATYGIGKWTVSKITLTLAGNFSIQGKQPNNPIFPTINTGHFGVDWLADDDWTTGSGMPSDPSTDGITYNNLSTITSGSDQSLGTFLFTPPGNNVQVTWNFGTSSSGLLSDITDGSDASFLLYPSDTTVAYLFNSLSYGTAANWPTLTITAAAIPEPATGGKLLAGLAGVALVCRRRRR